MSLALTPNPDAEWEEPLPAELSRHTPWYALTFSREVGTSDTGEHGLQLWYPASDDWHRRTQQIEWAPDALLGFEAMQQPDQQDTPLIDLPSVQLILGSAGATRASLARIFATWRDDLTFVNAPEDPGPADEVQDVY